MSTEFVPLAAFLRPIAQVDHVPEPDPLDSVDPPDDVEAACEGGELTEVLSQIRRFRASLADALEVAVERLVRDVAADVLARELALRPADVAEIVAAARRRYAADEPLRMCVHPDERERLHGVDIDVVGDARLRRGDVVIELRSGTIDASLGVRLEAVLERLIP
ncbi:MAG TPA: FliH/SctL family protein [Candidatus Baltobacteraceae bacterium]|nr:FliH/SctL family protein [Candidatus Baltobacteraceae bacterium]